MTYFQKLDISVFSFFDEVPDPVMVINQDSIIYVNSYWIDNFELDKDNWQNFVNEKAIQLEILRFFKSGEIPTIDYRKPLKSKNGQSHRYQWVFLNLNSNSDERYLFLKGRKQLSLSDFVSDESQNDTDVQSESELGFVKGLLKNSLDMLAIINENGFIKFVGSGAFEKTNINPEAIIGKSFQSFINNGDIEMIEGNLETLLQSKGDSKIDFWLRKPDGDRIYLECYCKNLLHDPIIEGFLISARDVTDYYKAKRSLEKRYDLEILINKISAKFVNADFHQLDKVFKDSLQMLGEFEKADRAYIFLVNDDLQMLNCVYEWTEIDIEPQIDQVKNIPIDEDALTMIALRKGDILIIPDVDKMEPKYRVEQGMYKLQGIKSVILIPIFSENRLIGFFGLDAVRSKRAWHEKDEYVLRQLGDIYAGSFINRAIKKSLDRNERLLESTEILAKAGSWRFSQTKKRIYFSKGMNNIFDLPAEVTSASISDLLRRIDKKGKKLLLSNLSKAIAKCSTTSGEFILKTSPEREKYILYSIQVKKAQGSEDLEVYGYCSDNTHKRDAENYLKLQSQILAQVDDPIMVTDTGWNILYMNRAAEKECDFSEGFGFKGTIFELFEFLTLDGKNIKKSLKKLKSGEFFKKEINLKTRNGVVQPYEVSVQAFLNDDKLKIGYSFVIRNLSNFVKQEALAKRAKMVVESSPAVLFTLDPNDNYRLVYITENIKQFGYKAEDLMDKGASILDIIHPDDVDQLVGYHETTKSTKGIAAFSGEYRIRKKDGTYRWVEDKTREVLDNEGRILLHEGLFQDVTDRKKAREDTLRSQERYRVLAANIPLTSIFLIDRDLRYIVAEGTTIESWGMKSSDFEGKSLEEVHKKNLHEIQPAVTRSLLLKDIVQKNIVFKGRTYEMTVRPIIYDDEVEYALGILRDISEEYEAKENLRKNEEKYRKLVEESTEIIFSLSTDMNLTYVSPNVYQFLGYLSKEVINKKLTDFLHEDDFSEFGKLLEEQQSFFGENQYLEFKLRRKDGVYRVFSSNGKLVTNEEGEIHYNGIARDITKLREAQRELLLAKEKAEQASLVKSQFLSVMSHEIRTPMNAVIGMAHLLLEEEPRPDQLENLKTLQFSAENLMGLINDILDYSKIDSGKIELENVEFDLENIINRIIHSYTYQAREKALNISLDMDKAVPKMMYGDPVRLGQIVNNLVSNAVKFTEEGFVKIGLEVVSEIEEKIEIRFVFEDSGIGIPEDKLESVFEAFTQASAATTRRFGGTGLGLAIVKRLVNLFGGEIKILRKNEGGSIFTFAISFQKVDKNYNFELEKEIRTDKNLKSSIILVAEDNLVNQVMIRKFLQKWEVKEIVITNDGREAIDAFESKNFDLVLLDLQMPEVDGFEVAKYIRSHENAAKKSIPIIALTASSLLDVKHQLDSVGMNDFISKPFNPDNLYTKMLKLL